MQTACAFLNSDIGGTVLIGVTDDKKIIGQAVSDSTKKEIAQELNKVESHASVDVEYISLAADRYVIALVVKPGVRAPYVYDRRSILYQWITRKMSQEKYEQLFMEVRPSSVAWESLTTNDCMINDLDKKRIRQIVGIAVSERRLTDVATSASVLRY